MGEVISVRPAILAEAIAKKPWLKGIAPGVVLANCRVVDPVNGVLSETQTISIEGGLFKSIEPAGSSDLSGAIDMKNQIVCPGLIDGHVHGCATPGADTMHDLVNLPNQVITLRCTDTLRRMIQRGFTTVRDCGGGTRFIADAIEEGLIVGPRLFQCGKALSQTGGHGDHIQGISGGSGDSCCGGHSETIARTIDGVGGVVKAVREELKQGADFIKIFIGGGVASQYCGLDSVQFLPEEVRAITQTAKQMGNKMCTAHAYTIPAMRHAIDNGVMGIEHGNFLDEQLAKEMAEKGIWLTPTLTTTRAIIRPPFEDFLPRSGQDKCRLVNAEGLRALKIAHEAGVKLIYGSDLLASFQAFQTEEFSNRASVLPAADILRHATIHPAEMLGCEGKLGVIAPGAFADLIVLGKNPLEDITVLDRPELYLRAVVKEGRLISGSIPG